MKKIQITAKFKIHKGKVDEFKKIANDAIAVVSENEKGKTCLQYDWFLNSEETECIVREIYVDSDATMVHLGNVGELLGQLLNISDFSAEFYGPMSEELKSAVAPFNPAVYNFYRAS